MNWANNLESIQLCCKSREMPSEGLLSSVRDTHGFQIEGFDIIFTGLCPDCADGA